MKTIAAVGLSGAIIFAASACQTHEALAPLVEQTSVRNAPASPSSARAPSPQTFVFLVTFPNDQISATWTGSGTFVDNGPAVYTTIQFGAFLSPVVGFQRFVSVQTGQIGSFTMELERVFPDRVGHWVITNGSGGYANLHGQGTWTRDPDIGPGSGTVTITCIGQVVVP